jgi:uncharacterized protein YigA (DUF484 family)
MTTEQRLDRLERIASLFVKAGLRARAHAREQDQKIDILIDAQVGNEERFAKLADAQARLADSQVHSDRRLDALIDIVREGRNGKSSEGTA